MASNNPPGSGSNLYRIQANHDYKEKTSKASVQPHQNNVISQSHMITNHATINQSASIINQESLICLQPVPMQPEMGQQLFQQVVVQQPEQQVLINQQDSYQVLNIQTPPMIQLAGLPVVQQTVPLQQPIELGANLTQPLLLNQQVLAVNNAVQPVQPQQIILQSNPGQQLIISPMIQPQTQQIQVIMTPTCNVITGQIMPVFDYASNQFVITDSESSLYKTGPHPSAQVVTVYSTSASRTSATEAVSVANQSSRDSILNPNVKYPDLDLAELHREMSSIINEASGSGKNDASNQTPEMVSMATETDQVVIPSIELSDIQTNQTDPRKVNLNAKHISKSNNPEIKSSVQNNINENKNLNKPGNFSIDIREQEEAIRSIIPIDECINEIDQNDTNQLCQMYQLAESEVKPRKIQRRRIGFKTCLNRQATLERMQCREEVTSSNQTRESVIVNKPNTFHDNSTLEISQNIVTLESNSGSNANDTCQSGSSEVVSGCKRSRESDSISSTSSSSQPCSSSSTCSDCIGKKRRRQRLSRLRKMRRKRRQAKIAKQMESTIDLISDNSETIIKQEETPSETKISNEKIDQNSSVSTGSNLSNSKQCLSTTQNESKVEDKNSLINLVKQCEDEHQQEQEQPLHHFVAQLEQLQKRCHENPSSTDDDL